MLGKLWAVFNAVRRHLHVNAVLDRDGPTGTVGSPRRQTGGNVNRFNPGGVQGRWVLNELAGAFEFGRSRHPISVGFSDNYPAVVGNFFLQGGHVGRSAAHRQADLEVFPVYE